MLNFSDQRADEDCALTRLVHRPRQPRPLPRGTVHWQPGCQGTYISVYLSIYIFISYISIDTYILHSFFQSIHYFSIYLSAYLGWSPGRWDWQRVHVHLPQLAHRATGRRFQVKHTRVVRPSVRPFIRAWRTPAAWFDSLLLFFLVCFRCRYSFFFFFFYLYSNERLEIILMHGWLYKMQIWPRSIKWVSSIREKRGTWNNIERQYKAKRKKKFLEGGKFKKRGMCKWTLHNQQYKLNQKISNVASSLYAPSTRLDLDLTNAILGSKWLKVKFLEPGGRYNQFYLL